MQTIRAKEYGSIEVPATHLVNAAGEVEIHSSLIGRDFIDIRLRKGTLQIFAGGYVGLIPLNDHFAIEVEPRAPISNLTRVLQIAGYTPVELDQFARGYAQDEDEMPNMRDIYARALCRLLEPMSAFGLMRDYRRVEGVTATPSGRVLMADKSTLLGLAGVSSRVAASRFERTVDIPINRCLKFALWLLAGRIGSQPKTRGVRETLRQLNLAHRLFDGVSLERRAPLLFLADPLVQGRRALPSTRSYYRDAVRLAAMVAQEASIALDRPGTDLRMLPLIINMDKAFESYIRIVLQSSEALQASALRVLDGNLDEGKKLLFDEEPSSHAQPDVVIAGRVGLAPAPLVADIKYKPARGPRPDRNDLNQVITYGASYRAPKALIVQPWGPKSMHRGLQMIGGIADLEIYQYVFDLSADDLGVEEQLFIDEIAKLVIPDRVLAKSA